MTDAVRSGRAPPGGSEIDDWAGLRGITVPLSGEGGADRVQLTAASRDGRIHLLAIWDDSTEYRGRPA